LSLLIIFILDTATNYDILLWSYNWGGKTIPLMIPKKNYQREKKSQSYYNLFYKLEIRNHIMHSSLKCNHSFFLGFYIYNLNRIEQQVQCDWSSHQMYSVM
jgi:hypothetical protein